MLTATPSAATAVLQATLGAILGYGWLTDAGGVLGWLEVMTPITKGCSPVRTMVAIPVPTATTIEDANAETVQRLCRSTSRPAANRCLRSTARSAMSPIVRAKMSNWMVRSAAECHCGLVGCGLARVLRTDGATAAAKNEMLLPRPVLPRSKGKK